MTIDLVTSLLPTLGRSSKAGFNVFDVMRHGTHEKQISNVFGWLLDAEGTHGLGDLFQRIFVDELQRSRPDAMALTSGSYLVRQEVNTSDVDVDQDIADLVLENQHVRLVIENYYTSDGHGHSYDSYIKYAQRDRGRGLVVLLCQTQESARQTDGWEDAAVITYSQVVNELRRQLPSGYEQKHPEAYSFIDQMHRKFLRGRGRMEDHEVLDFVAAMCATGEVVRYREQPQDAAAARFADDVSLQAREQFGAGRELLQRVKNRLKAYSERVLQNQLNETRDQFVTKVSANYSGIYRWSVNFEVDDMGSEGFGEANLQLKLGPSAWFANEQDPHWKQTVDRSTADYSHLFVTRARLREVRQSQVTLAEVLDGLRPDDTRLHDEIVDFWREVPLPE